MKRLRKQDGSSLIEVIMSMLILAVGMTAALGMARTGHAGLETGRRISYLTGLAQAKIEEELSLPYAALLGGDLEGEDEADGFRRTWTILPDTPGAGCLTIRVGMEWSDKTGGTHRMEFITLRTDGVVP